MLQSGSRISDLLTDEEPPNVEVKKMILTSTPDAIPTRDASSFNIVTDSEEDEDDSKADGEKHAAKTEAEDDSKVEKKEGVGNGQNRPTSSRLPQLDSKLEYEKPHRMRTPRSVRTPRRNTWQSPTRRPPRRPPRLNIPKIDSKKAAETASMSGQAFIRPALSKDSTPAGDREAKGCETPVEDDLEGEDVNLGVPIGRMNIGHSITCIAAMEKSENLCVAGTKNGWVALISKKGYTSRDFGLPKSPAVTCIAQLDKDNIIAGFANGYVVVWDTSSNQSYKHRAGRQPIACITCKSGRIAAASGYEVSIYSHKRRACLATIDIQGQMKSVRTDLVTAIRFVSKKLLVVGTSKGNVGVLTLDRVRSMNFMKSRVIPYLRYKKRIPKRSIHAILTRVERTEGKKVCDFTIRCVFDTPNGEETNTTVVDLGLEDFYTKNTRERVSMVGVSLIVMRNPCAKKNAILFSSEEGLIVWNGDDSTNGTERLFLCGNMKIDNYAWMNNRLHTCHNSEVLVWNLPSELIFSNKLDGNDTPLSQSIMSADDR
ncbi:hypothetical protein AAMO2058_000937500 [Amorphochlora amoebiformis]